MQFIETLKTMLGREWKFLSIFIVISLSNLLISNWIINLIGFIGDLALIGYIVLATNNEVVKKTVNSLKIPVK